MGLSKSTAVHKLNGTYKPARHAGRINAPMIGGMPDAPETMSDQARAWWRVKVIDLKDMGLLYRCDTDMLEKYCNLLVDMDDARAKINELTATSDVGARYRLLRYHNEALRYALLMAREFGFTPLARTRLKSGEDKEELNEFDAL